MFQHYNIETFLRNSNFCLKFFQNFLCVGQEGLEPSTPGRYLTLCRLTLKILPFKLSAIGHCFQRTTL